MKRIIFIESVLLFSFAALLNGAVSYWQSVYSCVAIDQVSCPPPWLAWAILNTIACVAILVVFIMIAIKEFPVFRPLIERHKARKTERAAARKEKSVEDKEKRLQELQAELEELKKE